LGGKRIDIPGEREEIVVVIDDDYPNVFAAASVLKTEGYGIKGFVSPEEGLKEILNNPAVTLAVVDLMMPGLNGAELARAVRKRFNLLELPVLILTAKTSLDGVVDCFEAGANDFLCKPFENEELKARVRTLSQLKVLSETAFENELKMLQAQINPHFLFNAMNAISECCYSDGEKAADLVGDLAEYLRHSFQFDHRKTILLTEELELVRAYLSIEKVRFGDKLDYRFDIRDSAGVEVLPLAVQTLVENAAVHGIRKKKGGGSILIEAYPSTNGYTIRVRDNGKGIRAEDLEDVYSGRKFSGNGVGLSNLQQRLQKYYGSGLGLESEYGKGTVATIYLS